MTTKEIRQIERAYRRKVAIANGDYAREDYERLVGIHFIKLLDEVLRLRKLKPHYPSQS